MPHVDAAQPFLLRRIKAPSRVSWARAFGAGILAGEVAGIAMAVAMVATFGFALGRSPFQPFEAIGATMLATAVSAPAPLGASALGFFVHQLVPSLGWGMVYGLLVVFAQPRTAKALLFLGLATGILAQVVDVYMLAPWLTDAGVLVDHWSRAVHPFWSWIFHLAFGVGLSVYPWKYDPVVARFV
jgi:hypothetical protein